MNQNNAYAIETSELNYMFRHGRKVVNNVSLKVPEGSIFGFLGPNIRTQKSEYTSFRNF
jgi:ABC-type lipopolysaccharide export system ATPase subunit